MPPSCPEISTTSACAFETPAATVPTPADETKADVFAAKAADSDMFEIEAAKVAAKRSTNPSVKKFAAAMEKH